MRRLAGLAVRLPGQLPAAADPVGSWHCQQLLFARQGCGIEINSDFPYVEGGVAHDITITDNTFVDVNPQPGGAAISMHTHTYNGGARPSATSSSPATPLSGPVPPPSGSIASTAA